MTTILNLLQMLNVTALLIVNILYIKQVKRKKELVNQFEKQFNEEIKKTAALNDLLFQEYYKICEPKTEEEIAKEDKDEERI